MRNFSSLKSVVTITLMLFVLIPGAYSQGGAIKLAYNFPSDNAVKYQSVSKIIQTMDVMGQVMEVNVAAILGCSIKSKGMLDENLNLEVKIDTMYQSVDSPQGSAGGVISEVKGKVFSMTITPQGKEVDLTEAVKVVYSIEGSGQSDLSQSFTDFFPDMPSASVSPGYTWSTTDTLNTKSTNNSMRMVVKSDNKFEGYEELNGVKCAKITSVLTGDRVIVTQSQGMDITVKGPFTGTSILLFSPEKGYFLRQSVNMKQTGTVEITTPENMSFPVVMDIATVNEVIK
jgi:hypothetical protein